MIETWAPTGKQLEAPEPTPAQVAKRKAYATKLCKGALDVNSWIMADRMAQRFECEGCIELGIYPPGEPDHAPQAGSNRNKQKR